MSKTTNEKPGIVDILKEATNGLLSDESISSIEQAFLEEVETRATLRTEAALDLQDQEYSQKLVKLLQAIDKDRTNKLKMVVESIDKSNVKKLKNVIAKYNSTLNEDGRQFKDDLIKKVSDYLELYIEELVPQAQITEAVKNKKAVTILAALRNQLSIGTTLLDESVRSAIIDGKDQIDALKKEIDARDRQVAKLNESLKTVSANLLLEQKSAGLPPKKKEYLKKVLGNKSPEFIAENFKYTLDLYEKKEDDQLRTITSEAYQERVIREDAPVVIVEKKTEKKEDSNMNFYMEGLSKLRK